jgi:hypothetical protein
MAEIVRDRWSRARVAVVERWRQILRHIQERDEAGALALANTMDEFCEEAMLTREASSSGRQGAVGPVPKISTSGAPTGSRCVFCQGFIESGGCFGMLDELNQAVLHGRWTDARRVAELYIDRLQSMHLE